MKKNEVGVKEGILVFIACIIILWGILNISFGNTEMGWIQFLGGIFALVFGGICQKICYEKKREESGFYYGYFLGIIGLLIVACLKDNSVEKTKVNISNTTSNNENKYEQLAKLRRIKGEKCFNRRRI